MIPCLGRERAAEFQRVVTVDTLRKVARLRGSFARYLFFTGGSLPQLPCARGLRLERQRGGDLGQRLAQGFKLLIRRHGWAIILGTDSPTLPPAILRQAQHELRTCDAALGPCPDGGYYVIGLRKYTRGIFAGVRWGTAFAFRDTLRNVLRAQFSCSILEPHADTDRPHDVGRLAAELRASAALRRLAPATWRFLKDNYPAAK